MAESLSTFLTNVGTFFTSALSWMGDLLDSVTSSPALLVLVLAIPIAGVAFGYVRRLISL